MNPKIGMIQWQQTNLSEGQADIRVINLATAKDGGICLSEAQQALADLRGECERVWVCAHGTAAPAALALAAQLMVDRLLIFGDPFADPAPGMRKMAAFARRNLSLIAAEAFLIGADDRCARWLARRMGRKAAHADPAWISQTGDFSERWLYTVNFH